MKYCSLVLLGATIVLVLSLSMLGPAGADQDSDDAHVPIARDITVGIGSLGGFTSEPIEVTEYPLITLVAQLDGNTDSVRAGGVHYYPRVSLRFETSNNRRTWKKIDTLAFDPTKDNLVEHYPMQRLAKNYGRWVRVQATFDGYYSTDAKLTRKQSHGTTASEVIRLSLALIRNRSS